MFYDVINSVSQIRQNTTCLFGEFKRKNLPIWQVFKQSSAISQRDGVVGAGSAVVAPGSVLVSGKPAQLKG